MKFGQFLFPHTASFPNDGWNSITNENAEPLYDEILFLPEEKKLTTIDENDDISEQSMRNSNIINYKNSFQSLPYLIQSRIFLNEKQFQQLKRSNFSTIPLNKSNSKEMIPIIAEQGGNLLIDYRSNNNDNIEDISSIPLNEIEDSSDSKSIVNAKAEFGGKVVIDMRGNENGKRRIFPSLSDEYKNNEHEALSSSEIFEDHSISNEGENSRRRHPRRILQHKKLTADIFRSIQLVRRDINGLKNDLQEVKEIVSAIHRKQNQSNIRRNDLKVLKESGETFANSRLEMNANINGNSSEQLRLPSILSVTSKTTPIPFKVTTTINKAENYEIRWNHSENLKLSELANLTVETAHQVFPILIQSSQSAQPFNRSTLSTTINHTKSPILIATNTSHSRLIFNNRHEVIKHGTLVRIGDDQGKLDEQGKLILRQVPHESKIFRGNSTTKGIGTGNFGSIEAKDGEEVLEKRWPFNVDRVDFAIDSTADTIHSGTDETIKVAGMNSQINMSNPFPEQFSRTLSSATFSVFDTKTDMTTQSYTTSPQTTNLLLVGNNNVTATYTTFPSYTASPEPETFEAFGTTTLAMERYTYKDPDSSSPDEGNQQTLHPSFDEVNYAVYEFRSTQQSPLWPDVLFQGG